LKLQFCFLDLSDLIQRRQQRTFKCVGHSFYSGNPIDYRSSEPVGNDKGILATRAGVEHQKIVELLNQTQKN
jgi:hypothetical protein